MTDRLPPLGPDGSNHTSVLELSALIDRALSVREAAAVNAHVEACLGCAEQLTRLRAASTALSSAGRPQAPPGAADSAVLAALAATAQITTQAALTDADTVTELAASRAGSDLPSSAPEVSPPSDTVTPAPQALKPPAQPLRAPWMPASWDSEKAKDRALARHKRTRFLIRAAVVVLLLGIATGGVLLATKKGPPTQSASGVSTTSLPRSTTNHTPPSSFASGTKPAITVSVPPVGVFALELRQVRRRTSCARLTKALFESINGNLVALNPPATRSAVLRPPGTPSRNAGCVSLSPAFATAWSKDITGTSIESLPASSPTSASQMVTFVVHMAPDAVANAARFDQAASRRFTTAIVAQGSDVGAAAVKATPSGSTLTMTLTKDAATFLQSQLK